MRTLLFAFLLLTLALRGWASDVMAIRMATHQGDVPSHAAMVTAATTVAPLNGLGGHADCMGHAQTANTEDAVADAAPGAGHCNTCSFCQLCFTAAVLLPDLRRFVLQLPQQPARFQSPTFISADPARGFKPPIS